MSKNKKNNDDMGMDEFMSDDSSNIAVEDFAIEADETGTFPEDRRSVEILDYRQNNEGGTNFDDSNESHDDIDQQDAVEKGRHLVHKIFSSRTGRISVYVFLALNVVAIVTPFILERMEAKRRKSKWWNFRF